MRTSAARVDDSGERVLCMVFGSSSRSWRLGLAADLGKSIWKRVVSVWDMGAYQSELSKAKTRLGLEGSAHVVSCYEAGREGFSLARHLEISRIENVAVDAGSLELKRRKRRAKTGRLDLETLMNRLIRWHRGERAVCGVVRVPSVEEEEQRQCHREHRALKQERTRHVNRIHGLLASQGVRMRVRPDFLAWLSDVRLWNGSELAAALRARLGREWTRMELVRKQIRELRTLRRQALEAPESKGVEKVLHLMELKGIGEKGS